MNPALWAMLGQSYATGWAVAAPIGPVNLEIIRRGLRIGWLPSIMVGLGACCIDALYFILFSVGFGALLNTPSVLRVLFGVGGLVLCWLGWTSLKDARAAGKSASKVLAETDGAHPAERTGRHSPLGSYLVGLGMTASNPMTVVFWSTLSLQFADKPFAWRVGGALSVLAGCLSWVTLVTTLIALGRRWVGPRLFAVVTFLGALVLFYYGASFLWKAVEGVTAHPPH